MLCLCVAWLKLNFTSNITFLAVQLELGQKSGEHVEMKLKLPL